MSKNVFPLPLFCVKRWGIITPKMSEKKAVPLQMLNQYTRNFKVLVVGDILTGKQSFVKRYVNNIWHPLYKPTIGVDFALKTIQWAQNTTIRLQIWLIAGQERFSSMTRVYYKGADACVVLFDLERQTTLDGAIKWKKDLDSKYKLHSRKPVPCILVGNKSDLPDRPVDKEIIDKLCKEHSFLCWTEMSVKEDINVKKPMEYLVKHLMEDGKEGSVPYKPVMDQKDPLENFPEEPDRFI